jgi:hypothetical protein
MESKKEIWLDISGFEGYYQVSNFGNVKSLERCIFTKSGFKKYKGRQLTPELLNNGYHRVQLSTPEKKQKQTVHRLVVETFLGKSDLIVNHKNGIKTDNRVDNLEYCTYSENAIHAVKNGLSKRKLTVSQAMSIKYGHKNDSVKSIAKKYNISRFTIYGIRNGHFWKHI